MAIRERRTYSAGPGITKASTGVERGLWMRRCFGRGAGEGLGVHLLTGPIYIEGAEPGDILEVRILDVRLRPSANPNHPGKAFGSNAAAWWGLSVQRFDHRTQATRSNHNL